jgi:antitoxin ParD1/3/4
MAAKQKTRNIALTAHFDKFVQRKIDSGHYQSASEVVRDSLRIMEQHERDRQMALANFREQIRSGYQEAIDGETVGVDDAFAEIKAISRAARKAGQRSK